MREDRRNLLFTLLSNNETNAQDSRESIDRLMDNLNTLLDSHILEGDSAYVKIEKTMSDIMDEINHACAMYDDIAYLKSELGID